MYWFNLTALKEELSRGSLPQAHAFQYALADAILTTLARAGGDPWWDVLIVAAFVGLGTAYCYEANGGSEGTDFIARYVSLGWVVGWRVSLACILPAVIVAAIAVRFAPNSSSWLAVLDLIVPVIYWRMGVHFADVRRRAAVDIHLSGA
jgi:uncharacterized membrane-anchored protein YitT (DUF2179 family)